MRKKAQPQTLTHEQIIDLARMIVREELAAQPNPGKVSGWLSAVVATTPPRIDGRITLADVFVSGAIVIGFFGCGTAAGVGSWLAGVPMDDAAAIAGKFTTGGAVIAAVRLAADGLNFAAIWRDTFGEFLDWLNNRNDDDNKPAPTVTRVIPYQGPPLEAIEVINPPAPGIGSELVELSPSARTMRKRELRDFLLHSFRFDDWTRDTWCGNPSRDKPGRGMSQPTWNALKKFLVALNVWETPDTPSLWSFIARLGYPVTNQTNETNHKV